MARKLDIESMFTSVADAGLDPSILETKLDLPKARNIIEWVEGEEFCNEGFFARQAEQAVRLFADFCPQCTDRGYLDNVPVADTMVTFKEKVSVLQEGWCPRCHKNRIQIFGDWWKAEGRDLYPDYPEEQYYPPFELIGCLGQRSGKSTMVGGYFSTYQVHRYLSLPNPTKYFGMAANAPVQGTFVSTVVTGALTNLWPSFHGAVENAPWFRSFAKKVREQEKRHGVKSGTLMNIGKESISIPLKHLHLSCGAADEKTLRGATRLFAGIDEIAFMSMDPNAKDASAEKTYDALSNSLHTIRSAADAMWENGDPHPLTGIMLNISSTAHKNDKIMNLLADCHKSPRMVGFHFATWDINPKITRKSLRDMEIRNPIEFMRSFGGVPPLAKDPFIPSIEAVELTQAKYEPTIYIDTCYEPIANVQHVAGAIRQPVLDRHTPRILALDAGYTNNSFGIGLYHVAKDGSDIIVKTDCVFSAIPEKTDAGHIKTNFIKMADVVVELSKMFNLKHVLFDRWQSIGEIQRLRQLGINATAYSPAWSDFEEVKSLILAGKLKTPMWEKSINDFNPEDVYDMRKHPYTHLGYQIATVQSVGKKVTKPVKGDDDMFRTLVLAVSKFRLDYLGYASTVGKNGVGSNQSPRVGGVMIGRNGQRGTATMGMGAGSARGIRGTVIQKRGNR